MLSLITSLLPLVSNLAPLLIALIQQIRSQPGMTDEQILAHAKATGDENTIALVTETLRLQAKIDSLQGGQK